jgi:hypothetical protein
MVSFKHIYKDYSAAVTMTALGEILSSFRGKEAGQITL